MINMLKGTLQVAGFMLLSLGMDQLAAWLNIGIPGSILGIVVVFILLETKVLRLEWIELGANWLLAELLLFFIPAAVGIMKYFPMLEAEGLQILAVVLFSTVIVMVSSGLTAGFISSRKERKTP
ncbi:CidA/LrgA family holin-like protein [Virgibacillus sp. LDC1]|jgi:holin-like protein|uniref:CidA/LrgA family protein n=1 Tax=Paenibacillus TaxID=44249 RepID=UPI000C271A4C|nr:MULTISPECIES: CidA/LrgA family holin-like protein [Paenibacillus]MCV4235346.1 CidA/LrgA family holin-like protein [Virgibacillus sp. LDC1]MBX4152108.1 CidA/LrgA family holin-like protein [Paenibacillus lautus]MCT1402597.1 CidA/LrgA family holin-like protein [Paenibacillus sp. p3-SID867]MEC0203333.1 CidA/LrgA family holin-like protein [Paenibacillus lautus]MEC0253743.1 CidA/LrgA family holin-like protein [Paenibacillus lautus]